jgi:hypothetical protein
MFILKKRYVDRKYWLKSLSFERKFRKAGIRFEKYKGTFYVKTKGRSIQFSSAEKMFNYISSRDPETLAYHLS